MKVPKSWVMISLTFWKHVKITFPLALSALWWHQDDLRVRTLLLPSEIGVRGWEWSWAGESVGRTYVTTRPCSHQVLILKSEIRWVWASLHSLQTWAGRGSGKGEMLKVKLSRIFDIPDSACPLYRSSLLSPPSPDFPLVSGVDNPVGDTSPHITHQ